MELVVYFLSFLSFCYAHYMLMDTVNKNATLQFNFINVLWVYLILYSELVFPMFCGVTYTIIINQTGLPVYILVEYKHGIDFNRILYPRMFRCPPRPLKESLGSLCSMSSQLVVFHLYNLPLHSVCLSTQTYQSSSLCFKNPWLILLSTWTDQQTPNPHFCFITTTELPIVNSVESPWQDFNTLGFELVRIINFVFPWHRQFQQNCLLCCQRPDDYFRPLLCDCCLL